MRSIHIVAASVLFALGGLSACASSPNERSTGQVVDDSSLTARVKTALARDTSLGTAMDVHVTTYRGVVQLSGFVDSQATAQRAEAVAKGVDGVRSVENDLRLAPSRS